MPMSQRKEALYLIIVMGIVGLLDYYFDFLDTKLWKFAVTFFIISCLFGHARLTEATGNLVLRLAKKIDESLHGAEDDDYRDDEDNDIPKAWKVDVAIEVKAYDYLRDKLPDLKDKTDREIWEYLLAITKENNLEFDQSTGLSQNVPHFTVFYDDTSGMKQIWSYLENRFVDEIEYRGHLLTDDFHTNEVLDELFPDTHIGGYLIVTSSKIGFNTWSPLISEIDEEIARVPYSKMLGLLKLSAKNNCGDPMRAIKRFPQYIQKALDETGYTYDSTWYDEFGREFTPTEKLWKPDNECCQKWLAENGVEFFQHRLSHHVFEAPFVSFRLRIIPLER